MPAKWLKDITNKVKSFKNRINVLEDSVLDERKRFRNVFERNLLLEREITERTDELNQANKRLLTLKHIWSTMNSAEPLSEVLFTVINGLSDELGYLYCFVFQVYNFESGARLKIRAANENSFSTKMQDILQNSIFSYDIPFNDENNIIVFDISTETNKFIIAATADTVKDVIEISENEIKPVPEMGISYHSKYISGAIRRNDKFILLLDIEKVFSLSDKESVELSPMIESIIHETVNQ